MGRMRKKGNEGLPKGVYKSKKMYYYMEYIDGSLVYGGSYKSVKKAEYYGFLKINGHHWKGMDKGDNFGFIYCITNKKTGKMYIGSKQFLLWDGPTGGYKCSDMRNDWFDPYAWRDNNWTEYTGSQKGLNKEISEGNIWDYTFEVLEMCQDKMSIHLSEVLRQLELNVLEELDEDGEYLYYNENIARTDFRAPFKKSDVLEARANDEAAMGSYYLKPDLDASGSVIPYGRLQNKVAPLETGGFDDIR